MDEKTKVIYTHKLNNSNNTRFFPGLVAIMKAKSFMKMYKCR